MRRDQESLFCLGPGEGKLRSRLLGVPKKCAVLLLFSLSHSTLTRPSLPASTPTCQSHLSPFKCQVGVSPGPISSCSQFFPAHSCLPSPADLLERRDWLVVAWTHAGGRGWVWAWVVWCWGPALHPVYQWLHRQTQGKLCVCVCVLCRGAKWDSEEAYDDMKFTTLSFRNVILPFPNWSKTLNCEPQGKIIQVGAFTFPRKGEKDQSMWLTLIFLAPAHMVWLKESCPINSRPRWAQGSFLGS